MKQEETDRQEIRCRRLGHEVPFSYCCTEGPNGQPCRLILNCWWERFDVTEHLRERLTPEEFAALEQASAAPPPNKTLNLLELIEQARKRIEQDAPPRS